MGMELDGKYHGKQLPGKTKMGVSGCKNQCAENCIKDISLVGKKTGWSLMVGGSGTGNPRLAQTLAEELDSEQALALVDKVIDYYCENANKNERIGKMIDRIGFETLQTAVLS
jgi:NAD(P)H-nitrite reductase large subunit